MTAVMGAGMRVLGVNLRGVGGKAGADVDDDPQRPKPVALLVVLLSTWKERRAFDRVVVPADTSLFEGVSCAGSSGTAPS